MAAKILINTVTFQLIGPGGGPSVMPAGETIADTGVQAAVAAAGGSLILTTDTVVASAAGIVEKLRSNGQADENTASRIMTAAAASSGSTSAASSASAAASSASAANVSALAAASSATAAASSATAANTSALAAASSASSAAATVPVHVTVDVPLSTINGKSSGVAFNVGAALPANAKLIAAWINIIQVVGGGTTIASADATLQNTSETAGAILGTTDVHSGTGKFLVAGSNPQPDRGGQQLQLTITAVGDTLANAGTGHLAVHWLYSVIA